MTTFYPLSGKAWLMDEVERLGPRVPGVASIERPTLASARVYFDDTRDWRAVVNDLAGRLQLYADMVLEEYRAEGDLLILRVAPEVVYVGEERQVHKTENFTDDTPAWDEVKA